MAWKITSLALLCTLALAYAQDKFANNTTPCDPEVYNNLEECCAMPKFFSNETFDACFQAEMTKLKQQANSPHRGKRSANGKKGGKKQGTLIMRRSSGPRGGPMCILQCVFANQSLLNADKTINLQAMQKAFVEASGPGWADLVQNVSGNCFIELQKSNFSNLPNVVGSAPSCKANCAMVLSCIRRQLTLRCPEQNLDQEVASCPQRIERLRSCDPFAIPTATGLVDGEVVKAINEGSKKKGKKEKQNNARKVPWSKNNRRP